MNILLVGEFSGFYINLKKGFQYLGHNATLLANNDGWKKIGGADIVISSKLPSIFGKISERLQYIFKLTALPQYDVILIVNPNIGINRISWLISRVINKKSKNIFLSACGLDVEYARYGLEKSFDYWPFDGCEEQVFLNINTHHYIMNIVDRVIPTFYDYAQAWRNSTYSSKLLKTIPLPIATNEIKPVFPEKDGKITFFHGLNAECKKGTKYIRCALENMQKKYPYEIDVIIDGHMPFNDYMKLMQKVDVVVDQCKCYSYGSMNGLYALSMGKILMGGFREECKKEYLIEDEIPGIINISPNIKNIEEEIEYIIKNRKYLNKWGRSNRKFVQTKHDCKIIANEYLDLFNDYLK
jgi:glycosyltransferase involved in cell wall biosynthesis